MRRSQHVGIEDLDSAARSAEHYNEYRKKYFAVFPGAFDVLRTLRERGMKLGILTNGFSETHREKIGLLSSATTSTRSSSPTRWA